MITRTCAGKGGVRGCRRRHCIRTLSKCHEFYHLNFTELDNSTNSILPRTGICKGGIRGCRRPHHICKLSKCHEIYHLNITNLIISQTWYCHEFDNSTNSIISRTGAGKGGIRGCRCRRRHHICILSKCHEFYHLNIINLKVLQTW